MIEKNLREKGSMKSFFKKAVFGILLFFLMSCSIVGIRKVKAAESGTKVMTITFKTSAQTVQIPVLMSEGYSGPDFQLENSRFNLLLKKTTSPIQISAEVERPDLIVSDSLSYPKTLKKGQLSNVSGQISFKYREEDQTNPVTLGFTIMPQIISMKINCVMTSAGAKGFCPSSGNYLTLRAGVSVSASGTNSGFKVQLRVLNSAGKTVFSKSMSTYSSGSIQYRWNGKASKNNSAGLKAGSYVKSGKYKMQVVVSYKDKTLPVPVLKKGKSFRVSANAPSGTAGLASAKTPLLYTGFQNVDYLAERMLSSAGVTSGMTDDEKVRRIYHYMTTNFHHIHYGADSKYTIYYDLNKLRKKVASFKKTSDSKYNSGKVFYTYNYYGLDWNMQRRAGVCSDHAAIFVVLCNHAGVEAGTCSGYYLNLNGTKAGHTWNYAIVGGNIWYYDVDVEIQNYGKGQGDYYWYKKTRAQAERTHQFT